MDKHPLAGNTDIDSAFSGTWQFYKKWFTPMYAISFIMALIISVLTSRIDLSSLQNTTDIAVMMETVKSFFGVYVVIMLIALFFNTLLQYFIIMKPLDENFSIIDAAGKVLTRYYLPLLVIFIVLFFFSMLAMMVGVLVLFVGILFAIPYVILFFAMATPLLIIEGRGIGDTISSLFKLVHKRFWPNMGWISVYVVLVTFFSLIVSTLVMLPFSGSVFGSVFNPEAATEVVNFTRNPAFVILSSLTSALTTPILPILGLVLYFNNSELNTGTTGERYDRSDHGKVTVEDLRP